MADTASLIARVKTEGVAAADKQLDDFAAAADRADASVNRLTPDVKKLDAEAQKAAKGGMSASRFQMQQVGYQVQDMVVQLQSGTSAFVAIGQQGSQLAGAFGPGGAVLGAVIALASAVGSVLYKSLGDAEIGTKELADAQKSLQIVLQQSENGAYKAADAFARLIRQGASAAVINAKVASAQQASNTELKSFQQIAREASKAGDTLWDGNAIGAASSLKTGAAVSSLNGYLDSFSKKMGISRDEAKQLVPLLADVQKKADAKSIAALAVETDKLSKKYSNQNAELVKLNGSLQDGVQASADNAAQQKALATIVEDTNRKQAASNDLYLRSLEVRASRGKEQAALERDLLKAQIKEKEGLTDAERQRANAAADKQYEAEIKKIDEQEKKKKELEDKSAMSAQKKIENEAARQQKAADTFLNTLARQNQNELKAIDAQESQKLKTLEKYHEEGLIKGQEYEDAKTQITLDADTKRNELLQKQTEARMKEQKSADAYIAQLQANFEGEAAELDRQYAIKQQKLDEFHQKGLVSEEDYQNAKAELQKQKNQDSLEMDLQTWDKIAGNIASASKESTALYKAASITQAIISTYLGATKALAEGGPILGPILAATTVALGMANVAKIRSAREQGGTLAVGQASTIAERNKPEVIMPASASRVRTAEQMRQIMGENGGSGGIKSLNIVNQTTGRIDDVQQQQDDEGRITLLIREVVSGDLQDSNSKISQSRRVTRNQPGFA